LSSGVVRVWCFIGLIAAASASVWNVNLTRFGAFTTFATPAVPWPVLAVAFFLAETYVVHLHFRQQARTLSASEIRLTVGFFFVSRAGLLAAQTLGAGTAIVVPRRQRGMKLWFNLAELSLACGVGLLVFRSIVPAGATGMQTWGPALLGAAVAHTLGVMLVTAV